MAWLFLAGAIIFEVAGTMCLRMASHGSRKWYLGVLGSYLVAFSSLSLALNEGIGLGVAYGIWTACGVALTAVLGKFLLKEPLTWVMGLGIVLVIGGVLLVEIG